MRITITTEDGGYFSLQVSHELTLGDLKALVEIETAGMANPDTMLLIHNMAPMTDPDKSLASYDVQQGDIIMVAVKSGDANISNPATRSQAGSSGARGNPLPVMDWSSVQLPGSSTSVDMTRVPADPNDPDNIRQQLLSDPYQLSILRQRNPAIVDALMDNDPQVFRDAYHRQVQTVREVERERIRMINADPFDPDAQERIAQTIHQRNIEENMHAAIEYTPESFSRVIMVYVNIKVNGVPVQALVDSGAGSTIMSEKCAERCNIMRLVDRRFAGVAYGIGKQPIIGKVHLGQIQIGGDFLTSSFMVLKDQAQDMLLGLDMLRRHQCCIDLKDDVLRIGTTGNHTPFLKESELEEMGKLGTEASMEGEDAEMAQAIAKSEREQSSRPTDSGPPDRVGGGSRPFTDEAIQKIVSAGFSQSTAETELERCNGNTDLALASLLARSL